MKRLVCAMFACLLAASLTACGGGGSESAASAAPDMMANHAVSSSEAAMIPEGDGMDYAPAAGEAAAEDAAVSVQVPLPDNRKIIRHLEMALETREFDDAIGKIRQSIADAGGYIQEENVTGRSLNTDGRGSRSAYLMARIPSERLDGVAQALPAFCNVVERMERTEDVTERYYDSEAHLKSLEVQEERLLAILEKADKLEDVVTLEQALAEVRYEIESITASLRHMDSQVAFSYLEMNLSEVVEYTQVQETPKTFGEELAASVSISAHRVGSTAKYMLLDFIEDGPVVLLRIVALLIPLIVIVWAVRFLLRRFGIDNRFTRKWRKSLEKQKQKPKAAQNPDDGAKEQQDETQTK